MRKMVGYWSAMEAAVYICIFNKVAVTKFNHMIVLLLFLFSLSQVSAISTDEAASSLTPISGYLSYSDGAIITGVTLTTKDDLVPEPSAVFTLQLTTSDGGSRIEPTASSASVTGQLASK